MKNTSSDRYNRLSAALKENLFKRKQQQRSRREKDQPENHPFPINNFANNTQSSPEEHSTENQKK